MRAVFGGVDLHYETSGVADGPWVTLVPGITNDASFWDHQIPNLEPHFRVLRFDPRGHGTSSAPSVAYDVVTLMADIVGLWDHVGIERAHLVGLGFGGSLSIGLALEQPDRVVSLTACCCRAVLTPDFVSAWEERATEVAECGIASVVDATVARWFTESFASEHPDRLAAVRAMVERTSSNGYVGHARAFATIDWSRDLHRLSVPTLLVSAGADPGGGRADVMQQMADQIAGARHVTIPGAGHLCNIEDPATFNRLLLDFLLRRATGRRLASITPGDLDADQQRVYQAIVDGPRARGPQRLPLTADDGSLVGPFNSMLLSPPAGMALQELGSALRFGTKLTDRQREMAILTVAAAQRSTFEWNAHKAIGHAAGLTDGEIEAIARGEAPPLDDVRERAVVAVVRQLLARSNLDDSTYADAVESLGERAVFELVTIVGYYSLLAMHLRVFDGETTPDR